MSDDLIKLCLGFWAFELLFPAVFLAIFWFCWRD